MQALHFFGDLDLLVVYTKEVVFHLSITNDLGSLKKGTTVEPQSWI